MKQPVSPHKSKKGIISENQASFEQYEGLLPSPETLAKFENISPGFADRMLRMAENALENQNWIERKNMKHFMITAIIGFVTAFLSVLVIGGICVFALHLGYPTAAASMLVGSAAAVAGAFLLNRSKSK